MSENPLQNLNEVNGEIHEHWHKSKEELLYLRDAFLAIGMTNAVETIECVVKGMVAPLKKLDKCVGAVIVDSVHNAELSAQNTLAACLAGIGSTDDDDSDRNNPE